MMWLQTKYKKYFLPLILLIAILVIANLKPPQKPINHTVTIDYSPEDSQFLRAMGHLLGPPIVAGNRITAFQNGAEIFPAMLEAIQSAKKTITFESYIYWSGNIGEKFAQALIDRAQAGVNVHVLVDWLGSRQMQTDYYDRMKKAGIEIEFYHPIRWYNISRMNNRTHRKILVVDGKIGFTGGVGISDDWDGHGDQPDKWRDSHYRIEGPGVRYLQAAFMDNWLKTRPEVRHDVSYFPEVPSAGKSLTQVFMSSPREGSASMRLMYLMAIAAARKKILISSAYFVPDEVAVEALVKAVARGVKVQIIVPGEYTDSEVAKRASRTQWGSLLAGGVEIYEFQPARFHCKILIVDDLFASVGSTNFDERSFSLNDEANLNVIDVEFAKAQSEVFYKDLTHSRPYTLKNWRDRPWYEQIYDIMALTLKSQL